MDEIIVGDTVQVSPNTHRSSALTSFDAVLLAFPTQQFPYWRFKAENRITYMVNVTVSKTV